MYVLISSHRSHPTAATLHIILFTFHRTALPSRPPLTLANSQSLGTSSRGSSISSSRYVFSPPTCARCLRASRPVYPFLWKCLLPPPITIGPIWRRLRMQKWVPQTLRRMNPTMRGSPTASPNSEGLGRLLGDVLIGTALGFEVMTITGPEWGPRAPGVLTWSLPIMKNTSCWSTGTLIPWSMRVWFRSQSFCGCYHFIS